MEKNITWLILQAPSITLGGPGSRARPVFGETFVGAGDEVCSRLRGLSWLVAIINSLEVQREDRAPEVFFALSRPFVPRMNEPTYSAGWLDGWREDPYGGGREGGQTYDGGALRAAE